MKKDGVAFFQLSFSQPLTICVHRNRGIHMPFCMGIPGLPQESDDLRCFSTFAANDFLVFAAEMHAFFFGAKVNTTFRIFSQLTITHGPRSRGRQKNDFIFSPN